LFCGDQTISVTRWLPRHHTASADLVFWPSELKINVAVTPALLQTRLTTILVFIHGFFSS